MDRRSAMGQITAGAALIASMPQLASADGAVSAQTIFRARGIYGSRVAALADAVKKGDFAAVAAEKNAFILFNSGAYPGAKNKALAKKAVEQTNDVFKAIRAQDKKALSTAYAAYISTNEIAPMPIVDVKDGQGFGGDSDYRARTNAGAVYVR